jgi:GNAT superfamily N-acetyltransferase
VEYRIWVSEAFRKQGIGKKLVHAVQSDFIKRHNLLLDEIAFISPTDQGKIFAEAITKRKDFYVYK